MQPAAVFLRGIDLLVVAATLLARAAPQEAPPPLDTPPVPTSESAPTPVPAATASMSAAEVAALAEKVAPIVEEIRGLKFRRPVPVTIVDDAEARAHFETRVAKFWPEARIRAEERAYADLGLLPRETDLVAGILDVLDEQAGGYYDPDRDTFFVLGDLPRATAPIIMAHEMTHALDDQAFGIDALIEKAEGSDGEGALEAVVEGSGTVVMSVFILRQIASGALDPQTLVEFQGSEAGRAERLKAAPMFVQRSLIAPYILGMAFLLRGEMIRMQTGGVTPSDIDRALREPPLSTEQILHPEKYWDAPKRDLPQHVDLPDLSPLLGAGWSRAGDGTLGELTLALLTGLDPGDPTSTDRPLERWTNAAATGWGGDLWQLYRRGEQSVTVLMTLWDSARDAREFVDAVQVPAGARVRRRGDAVVVVAGEAGARAAALADAALRSLRAPPTTAGR